MLGAETWTLDSAVDSLALWWREAGLHTLTTDEPFDWFAADAASRPMIAAAFATAPKLAPPATRQQEQGDPNTVPWSFGSAFPTDLDAFLAWLEQDATQPEAQWGGPALPLPRVIEAPLMVVSEIPGESGNAALDPPAQALLGAMLAAIGLATDEDAAFATLASRRPAGGLIAQEELAPLGRRFVHYLSLTRPRVLILLGDRTARAFDAASGDLGDDGLQSVKTSAGTIPIVAIPHPTLMMRRPRAKAESWKTLRHLSGTIG